MAGWWGEKSDSPRRGFFLGNEEMNQTGIWPFKMIDPKKIDGWKLQVPSSQIYGHETGKQRAA